MYRGETVANRPIGHSAERPRFLRDLTEPVWADTVEPFWYFHFVLCKRNLALLVHLAEGQSREPRHGGRVQPVSPAGHRAGRCWRGCQPPARTKQVRTRANSPNMKNHC